MAVTIDITDNATQALRDLMEQMGPEKLNRYAGREGLRIVKEHLAERDNTHANKMGGTRTHFYAQARESTSMRTEEGGARISIAQVGIRQRYQGGTISAGRGTSSATGGPTRYLTIPACAEAYGHRASFFTNLVPLYRRQGGVLRMFALAEGARTDIDWKIKKKKGSQVWQYARAAGGRIMYWLVKSVTLVGDPTVIPSDEKLRVGILEALTRYLKSKV